MKVIVELSMYPLREDYEGPILQFLERLNQHQEVEINTNPMSTQIMGDYDTIMALLTKEMRTALQTEPATVMVMKILNR